ncbi:hypothetical protein AgCh_003763 [Apium graveolens]
MCFGHDFLQVVECPEVQGCHFFEWIDEGFNGRAYDVVTHLNHRRVYLEEKLKLVEENLEEAVEKRRLVKGEKMQVEEANKDLEAEIERLRSNLKMCVFVAVAAALIMLFVR